jgi:hypothetical protein
VHADNQPRNLEPGNTANGTIATTVATTTATVSGDKIREGQPDVPLLHHTKRSVGFSTFASASTSGHACDSARAVVKVEK